MSIQVRNLTPSKAEAVIAHVNKCRLDALKMRAGLIFHADASTAVAVANAVSGDGYVTSIALVNALAAAYTAHIASACDVLLGTGCHIAADATNVISAPTAVDWTTVSTLVNQLKTQFNAHCAVTSIHAVADAVNTVSTANATTDVTLAALANALKVGINAHFAAALNDQALVEVSP